MRMSKSLLCFGSLVIISFLVVAAFGQGSGTKQQPEGSATKPGTAQGSPAGSLRVQSLDGSWADLQSVTANQPTLLIFWASWSPNFKRLTPDFKETHSRFSGKGLNVIGVNIGIRDSLEKAGEFVRENGIRYPVYFDANQEATKAYGVTATPGILLLDRGGDVVFRGNSIDTKAIEALLSGQPLPQPRQERKQAPAEGSGSQGSGSK